MFILPSVDSICLLDQAIKTTLMTKVLLCSIDLETGLT